jgi:phospholipase/lecithinase/hemolysin/uncharacterized protein YhjY with autotransporter beta-barrel domain
MFQFNRSARLALIAATALTAIAAPAAAQQIDRIVAFGDSYADDGNFFELTGIPPVSTSIYTSGRFSGGTNYIDTLGQILQVPIENFAIGGALARSFQLPIGPATTITSFNTNCAPSAPYNVVCDKGFAYEVDQFLNVGTQSTAFPSGVPSFDEGDLLAVSVGANDARYYQRLGGTLASAPAEAAISVAGATLQLDRLVAAGAPTISFLAGDTSRLPEIAADPNAQAVRAAYSSAFNIGIQTPLAGYAADGVIVHYLDLNRMFDNVIANPGAYGITAGLVCPAFQPATPASSTCVVDSSGYLFYGDGLHLTSTGFAIIARYVAAQLAAPLTLQAPSDIGMDVGRQFGRTLTDRLDLGAPRDGDMAEGMHAFIVGDAYSRTIGSSRGNDPFDSDAIGITAGVDYGFGNGVVGLAGNYSNPKANFGTGASDVKSHSLQLGAYGGMGLGGGFVQGYVGYGWDSHDIDRRGVVEDMSASPNGSHWIAGAKAGYLMTMGDVRVGPIAALDYAHVKVDGYTEEGDSALTLNVGSTKFSSLRGSIGGEVRGDFAGGGIQFRPYAAVVLEKELAGGDRSVSFAQTSAPIIVNHFDFENVSKKIYGRGTVGGTARIFSTTSLDAGISMTAGKDQGNETSGHLGIRVGF